ncbi:MAG: hypothetical protein U0232_21685 [Thermomicrobiales bacterium]
MTRRSPNPNPDPHHARTVGVSQAWSNCIGLANNASTYRAVLQTALASADPGTITAADGGAWRIWLQSWGNNNVSRHDRSC